LGRDAGRTLGFQPKTPRAKLTSGYEPCSWCCADRTLLELQIDSHVLWIDEEKHDHPD